jgi:hypothetical protein
MSREQVFERDVKTRLLTIEERQALLDTGMYGPIFNDEYPEGRPATVQDLDKITKIIATRNILTGEWKYFE